MHKVLLILGLLLRGPLHGYELYRIIEAHGELYADVKKANLYYLLDRLADEGDLEVEIESGAQGPRRERLVYTLTNQGREHFLKLLREILLTYEVIHTSVDTAIVFLSHLPLAEGIELLEERRRIVAARRAQFPPLPSTDTAPLVRISIDHMVSLIDTELAWIDRSIAYLSSLNQEGRREDPGLHTEAFLDL
ncbi:MAG: PadR family transcriptional regulator [Ktedonobacteraceae bacterium]|nr:PadR family transcriptional regulator [Ktedonobacteraceae bacterium]